MLSRASLRQKKKRSLFWERNPAMWGPQHWPESLGPLSVPVSKAKTLSIVIDDKLCMKPQVIKTAATCFAILKWLRDIKWQIPFSAQRTLIQALVISRLGYGNVYYLEADKTALNDCKLPRIQ